MNAEKIQIIRNEGEKQFRTLRESTTIEQINQVLRNIGWPARMTIQLENYLNGLCYARAIHKEQAISPKAAVEIGYRVLNTSLVDGTNFKELDQESPNVSQNTFELAEYISIETFLLSAALNQAASLHLENIPSEDRSPAMRASLLFESLNQNTDWVPKLPNNRAIPLIFSADGFFNRIVMPNGRTELITQS